MIIQIGIRRNLLYPLLLIVFTFFRKVDSITMNKACKFEGSLLLTLIMFLAELISGLLLFIYYNSFLKKRSVTNYMGIKFVQPKLRMTRLDTIYKIYFLIFLAAFYDFNVFILQTLYLPKYDIANSTLDMRLRCVLTVSSAILCYYVLRLPIYKHQKYSLIMISICLVLVIILEFIFQLNFAETSLGNLIRVLSLMVINYVLNTFLDIVEKYLLEYDFINPFQLLMLEGFFGFILTFLYSFVENPFKEIKTSRNLILLIICFIIYFITSGGRNVYRILTNKLYSPMTRTLTDSILDPLLIIYYYVMEGDFKVSNNQQSIFFFIVNLILSFIIVFFGCIYNELLVLYIFDLDYDTHHGVSRRSKMIESVSELSSYEKEETVWD